MCGEVLLRAEAGFCKLWVASESKSWEEELGRDGLILWLCRLSGTCDKAEAGVSAHHSEA